MMTTADGNLVRQSSVSVVCVKYGKDFEADENILHKEPAITSYQWLAIDGKWVFCPITEKKIEYVLILQN